RNPKLGVVTFRTLIYFLFWNQQLEQPCLDNGLPITARYPDDRVLELFSMVGNQFLHKMQDIVNFDDIDIVFTLKKGNRIGDYEITNPFLVGIRNKIMTITSGFKGKE